MEVPLAGDFAAALVAALDFCAGLEDFWAEGFAALAEDLAGAAFRTGAFSAAARFGFGLADLALSLPLLAEVFDEALCGAVREEAFFAPLMTGSLMRCTRFSQMTPNQKAGSADLAED